MDVGEKHDEKTLNLRPGQSTGCNFEVIRKAHDTRREHKKQTCCTADGANLPFKGFGRNQSPKILPFVASSKKNSVFNIIRKKLKFQGCFS